jgi:hypothetical protein
VLNKDINMAMRILRRIDAIPRAAHMTKSLENVCSNYSSYVRLALDGISARRKAKLPSSIYRKACSPLSRWGALPLWLGVSAQLVRMCDPMLQPTTAHAWKSSTVAKYNPTPPSRPSTHKTSKTKQASSR